MAKLIRYKKRDVCVRGIWREQSSEAITLAECDEVFAETKMPIALTKCVGDAVLASGLEPFELHMDKDHEFAVMTFHGNDADKRTRFIFRVIRSE